MRMRAAAEQAPGARRRRFAVDRRHLDRHEARAAQPGARLARRFGLHHAAARAAFGVDGDVAEGGHGYDSRVTRIASSRE